MGDDKEDAFTYDGGIVKRGESQNIRYGISQTYLGEPVRIPVTILNGEEPGPTVFLTAAVHGDELNGIEVVREIANNWEPADIHGTLICLPILNVPGFLTQERYLPIYDRDLNRSFPGYEDGTGSQRMAHQIYRNFIGPCDLGLDFHTSTRGRTNMFHVRADMDNEEVKRLARSFGSNVIISTEGSSGMLRYEATQDGIPTITIEMGEAHRFERGLIDRAIGGVNSVFAEYEIDPNGAVNWPGWSVVIEGWDEKTWIRANSGGLVDMHYNRGDFVHEGDTICTITNPFETQREPVKAPFTGLLVGVLENPLVYPGNPLCHLVKLDEKTQKVIEKEKKVKE